MATPEQSKGSVQTFLNTINKMSAFYIEGEGIVNEVMVAPMLGVWQSVFGRSLASGIWLRVVQFCVRTLTGTSLQSS